jgi:hypothetical protein
MLASIMAMILSKKSASFVQIMLWRSKRERVQNPRPASDSFMKRGKLVFLVWRMHAIVFEAEADHQSIHPKIVLEGADHRNRAAASG